MSEDNMEAGPEPEQAGKGLSKLDRDEQEQASAGVGAGGADDNSPDRTSTLRKLDHLAGCVILGVVSTARANSARGIFATMLSNMRETSDAGAAPFADDDVLRLYRENPAMLKVIAPMLTKEQVDLVIRRATDGE